MRICVADWQKCAEQIACCETCVEAYTLRYVTRCTNGRTPTCRDYAKIHNGGPLGCRSTNNTFWRRVKSFCDVMSEGCDQVVSTSLKILYPVSVLRQHPQPESDQPPLRSRRSATSFDASEPTVGGGELPNELPPSLSIRQLPFQQRSPNFGGSSNSSSHPNSSSRSKRAVSPFDELKQPDGSGEVDGEFLPITS